MAYADIAFWLQDLVPYLVRHQSKAASKSTGGAHSANTASISSDSFLSGLEWPIGKRPGWWAGAFIAPSTNYCKRANTLANYADVNKWDLLILHTNPAWNCIDILNYLSFSSIYWLYITWKGMGTFLLSSFQLSNRTIWTNSAHKYLKTQVFLSTIRLDGSELEWYPLQERALLS